MGNRLLTDKCLRCGTTLIVDAMGNFNELHCCSSCTDFINRQLYEMRSRKRRKVKVGTIKTAKPYHPVTFVVGHGREPE